MSASKAAFAVFGLIGIAAMFMQGGKPTEAALHTIPTAQKTLTEYLAYYKRIYRTAQDNDNDIQRNKLAIERNDSLCKMDPTVMDWFGEIYSVKTGLVDYQNKEASITVKIGDTFWFVMRDIKNDDPMFSTLGFLNRGDKIRFDGEFIATEKCNMKEKSITQSGSMRDPEFLFRFTRIERNPAVR